jgi:hypothetical protein
MTRARPAPSERRALRLFGDAVLAFSDDPGPENLERYLATSRMLEESRRSRPTPAQARPRTGLSEMRPQKEVSVPTTAIEGETP